MRAKRHIFLVSVLVLACIFLITGCESLRKKFTRTKKKKDAQEVMIITPRDYSAHPFPNDVLYKQYFIYWKSWNQELVASLTDKESPKKVLSCVEQALVNLKKMSTYLKDEKAQELGVYIKETEDLKIEIIEARAMAPSQMNLFRYKAERILSRVNRQFDLTKMKAFLK